MVEFNYKRAWDQAIMPEYRKLSDVVMGALRATESEVGNLSQDGARHSLIGVTTQLEGLFDAIELEELAWASQVVYYYGHLAYNGECQSGGLYWKFQILADTSIIKRGGSESQGGAKSKMRGILKGFDDHKVGTEYDNEELPGFLRGILPGIGEVLSILRADYVNHKPHPFVIGPRHFGDMYIDPHKAGCAHCGRSYEEHTSERALFIRSKTDDDDKLRSALQSIVQACTDNDIKLDGFAFVG